MLQKTTEKALVTARSEESKQLKESISKGNIPALVAAPGLGRKALLQHFAAEEKAVYIDLKRISMSPESFAVEFLAAASGMTLEETKKKADAKTKDIISRIEAELLKIKPDQKALIAAALGYPKAVGAKIILDSFEEFLKLDNFKQIDDCLDLLQKSQSGFIISSSAQDLMKRSLKGKQFDLITVGPFSPELTKTYFEGIAGKQDKRIADEVHRLTGGSPFFIRNIAKRFDKEKSGDTQKDIKLVEYILISDLANEDSRSYSFCSKLFTEALARARGDTLLKTIVKAVSQNSPMRLTEIARLVYRSGPVTKSLLERLIEVDLISKSGNTFDFSDRVLKTWCALYFRNATYAEVPDEDTLRRAGLLGGGM